MANLKETSIEDTIKQYLLKALDEKPVKVSIKTIQDLCNKVPNKDTNLTSALKSIFEVELFSGITTDQVFSALYTILTIVIIILQQRQKNSVVYSNKYFDLNLGISVFQIVLGIITLAFAIYQTRQYLLGKTFVLAERQFDILIKLMSAILLFGTAIVTLKTDTSIKKHKPKPIPTVKRESKFF